MNDPLATTRKIHQDLVAALADVRYALAELRSQPEPDLEMIAELEVLQQRAAAIFPRYEQLEAEYENGNV